MVIRDIGWEGMEKEYKNCFFNYLDLKFKRLGEGKN